MVMRPRGWHLWEHHVVVDGSPVPGALFDFALYFWHNCRALLEAGHGPYFYLVRGLVGVGDSACSGSLAMGSCSAGQCGSKVP